MGTEKNRRRNYYIDRQFQLGFIIKFCALVVIGSVISGAIVYLMSKSTVCTIFENSRLTIKSTADFILPAVLLSGLVSLVLVGLATIIVTLFTSHKIAGPLYRLDKDVQQITSGNLKVTFKLRQGDEIRPLALSLNNMAIALRSNIVEAKKEIKDLELSLNNPEKTKENIGRVKESLGKFIT
jgi:nitrogen fixation/metabolism regulation signal transduction histidine kinase